MHACMYARTHACMHAYVHACMHGVRWCRLTAEHSGHVAALGGQAHQPCTQVDHVAHRRVLAPLWTSNYSAEGPPCRHADACLDALCGRAAVHRALQCERRPHPSRRVVRMRAWREAKDTEECGALVVDQHLVDLYGYMCMYRAGGSWLGAGLAGMVTVGVVVGSGWWIGWGSGLG